MCWYWVMRKKVAFVVGHHQKVWKPEDSVLFKIDLTWLLFCLKRYYRWYQILYGLSPPPSKVGIPKCY